MKYTFRKKMLVYCSSLDIQSYGKTLAVFHLTAPELLTNEEICFDIHQNPCDSAISRMKSHGFRGPLEFTYCKHRKPFLICK
jgi:hypothetical protein